MAASVLALVPSAACGEDPVPPTLDEFVEHALRRNPQIGVATDKDTWIERYRCLYERTRDDPAFQAGFVEVPRGEELTGELARTFNREAAACVVGR